jgi:PAS domain-containing protein
MKKFIVAGLLLLLVIPAYAFKTTGQYTLINKTAYNITGISLSPREEGSWSSLRISGTLQAGERTETNYEPSSETCSYDIKFTDDRGNEHVIKNVELCNTSTITLFVSEPGNRADVKINPVVK